MRVTKGQLLVVMLFSAVLLSVLAVVSLYISGSHTWFFDYDSDTSYKCPDCHTGIEAEILSMPGGSPHRALYVNNNCSVCHLNMTIGWVPIGNHSGFIPQCQGCHPDTEPERDGDSEKGTQNLSALTEAHRLMYENAPDTDIDPGTNGACLACHSRANLTVSFNRTKWYNFTIDSDWTISQVQNGPMFNAGTYDINYASNTDLGKHFWMKDKGCAGTTGCHQDIEYARMAGYSANGISGGHHSNITGNHTRDDSCTVCHQNEDPAKDYHAAQKVNCTYSGCHNIQSANMTTIFTQMDSVLTDYQRGDLCWGCHAGYDWIDPGAGGIELQVENERNYNVSYNVSGTWQKIYPDPNVNCSSCHNDSLPNVPPIPSWSGKYVDHSTTSFYAYTADGTTGCVNCHDEAWLPHHMDWNQTRHEIQISYNDYLGTFGADNAFCDQACHYSVLDWRSYLGAGSEGSYRTTTQNIMVIESLEFNTYGGKHRTPFVLKLPSYDGYCSDDCHIEHQYIPTCTDCHNGTMQLDHRLPIGQGSPWVGTLGLMYNVDTIYVDAPGDEVITTGYSLSGTYFDTQADDDVRRVIREKNLGDYSVFVTYKLGPVVDDGDYTLYFYGSSNNTAGEDFRAEYRINGGAVNPLSVMTTTADTADSAALAGLNAGDFVFVNITDDDVDDANQYEVRIDYIALVNTTGPTAITNAQCNYCHNASAHNPRFVSWSDFNETAGYGEDSIDRGFCNQTCHDPDSDAVYAGPADHAAANQTLTGTTTIHSTSDILDVGGNLSYWISLGSPVDGDGVECTDCHYNGTGDHNSSTTDLTCLNIGNNNCHFVSGLGVDPDGIYQISVGIFTPSQDHSTYDLTTDCYACHPGGGHDPVAAGCHPGGSCWATSDAHPPHMDTDWAVPRYDYNCSQCHFLAAGVWNSTYDVGGWHNDGDNDVAFNISTPTTWGIATYGNVLSPTWDGVAKTCTDTYCHSNGYDVGGAGWIPSTPTWNSPGSVACGDCHGILPITSSHPKHVNGVSYQFNCSECHFNAGGNAKGYVDTTYGTIEHVDGQVQVNFNNTATGIALHFGDAAFTGVWNAGTKECSDIWCHNPSDGTDGNANDPTPIWDNAATTFCGAGGGGSCHGDRTQNNRPLSGAHDKHLGNNLPDTSNSPNYTYACAECHNGGAVGTDTYGTASHVDGNPTMVFDEIASGTNTNRVGILGSPSYAPGASLRTGTCSSVYCHSNGAASEAGALGPGGSYTPADLGNVADVANVYSNLPWNAGVNSVGCSGQGRTYTCHNGDTLGNAVGNSADYPATGDHQRNAHRNDDPCWWCHNLERDAGFTGQGLDYQGTYGTAYHVDASLWFDPHGTPTGGTMYDIAGDQNGYEDGHCGSGRTCWY